MLAAIFSQIGLDFFTKLLDKSGDIWVAYINKQITREQLIEKLNEASLGVVKEIEAANDDALKATYEAFQATLRTSRVIQAAWVVLFVSQTAVLVWHQVGIPALCFVLNDPHCYPSSGTTVQWAYLLLAFQLGAGPIVFRAGPGAGSIASMLKGLIGKS